MGARVGRSTLFGIPLQQTWDYGNTGDFAPRIPATDARSILLVHRASSPWPTVADTPAQARLDPMIPGFNPTTCTPRSHSSCPDDLSGVSGIGEFTIHKDSSHQKWRENRESDQSSARSHPGFCWRGGAGGHFSQRHRHAVPACRPGAVSGSPAEGALHAASEDVDNLGTRRNRPNREAGQRSARDARPGAQRSGAEAPEHRHPWDEVAKYVVDSPESTRPQRIDHRHPDRFLFGSDVVAPADAKPRPRS